MVLEPPPYFKQRGNTSKRRGSISWLNRTVSPNETSVEPFTSKLPGQRLVGQLAGGSAESRNMRCQSSKQSSAHKR